MLLIYPQGILLIGLNLPTYLTVCTPKQHLESSPAMGVCKIIQLLPVFLRTHISQVF